jgi:hypothetical protein
MGKRMSLSPSTETVIHTPGPWLQSSTVLVCNAEAKVIANCTPLSEIPQLAIPIMQADANARLIAAAPELLEALEPFAKFACGCGECHNCRALAAVNKARGA